MNFPDHLRSFFPNVIDKIRRRGLRSQTDAHQGFDLTIYSGTKLPESQVANRSIGESYRQDTFTLTDHQMLDLIKANRNALEYNPANYNPMFIYYLYKQLEASDPAVKIIGEELTRIFGEVAQGEQSQQPIIGELSLILVKAMQNNYEQKVAFADSERTIVSFSTMNPDINRQTPAIQSDFAFADEPTISMNPSQHHLRTVEEDTIFEQEMQEDSLKERNRQLSENISTERNRHLELLRQESKTHKKSRKRQRVRPVRRRGEYEDISEKKIHFTFEPHENYLNFLAFYLPCSFEFESLDRLTELNDRVKVSYDWKFDQFVDYVLNPQDFKELSSTQEFTDMRMAALDNIYQKKIARAYQQNKQYPSLDEIKSKAEKALLDRLFGNLVQAGLVDDRYLVSPITAANIHMLLLRLKHESNQRHFTEAIEDYELLLAEANDLVPNILNISDQYGIVTAINNLFEPLIDAMIPAKNG